MPARHDEFDMVSESQRRAADKYQKSNVVQYSVKLNIKTDDDIIRFMWTVSNKNSLFKKLLREEIARRDGQKKTAEQLPE